MGRILILCPLAIEGRAARLAVGSREGVEVRITGPGERLLRALHEGVSDADEKPALVVLAGVCGGMCECERSPRVGHVMDLSGARWDAPEHGPPDPASRTPDAPVTVLGLHMAIESREAKRALCRRTGAALVDMESHLFARTCEQLGVRWCVIRGVSDNARAGLVSGAEGWVDADGETITRLVLRDCATRPWIVPAVLRLGLGTTLALRAVRRRLAALLDQQQHRADNPA